MLVDYLGGAGDDELQEQLMGAGLAWVEGDLGGAVAGDHVLVLLPVVPVYFGDQKVCAWLELDLDGAVLEGGGVEF